MYMDPLHNTTSVRQDKYGGRDEMKIVNKCTGGTDGREDW